MEVLDNKDNVKMRLNVLEYNLKESFDDDYFKLNDNFEEPKKEENAENITENQNTENKQEDNKEVKETEETSKIDEVVYPMYLPVNTYLSNQDKVATEDGERVIMTFAGDTPFLLVQENAKVNNTTEFVNGDPYLILDTIGAVNDYSVSWINNGIEYNVVSDSMDVEELITVAESITTVAIGK